MGAKDEERDAAFKEGRTRWDWRERFRGWHSGRVGFDRGNGQREEDGTEALWGPWDSRLELSGDHFGRGVRNEITSVDIEILICPNSSAVLGAKINSTSFQAPATNSCGNDASILRHDCSCFPPTL